MSLSAFPLYEILTAPAINKTYGYIQSGDISLLFINHGTPFCYHFSKMCIPLPSRGKTDIKHLWSYEIISTKSSSMYDKHNRHIFHFFILIVSGTKSMAIITHSAYETKCTNNIFIYFKNIAFLYINQFFWCIL